MTACKGKVTMAAHKEILLTSGGGYIRIKDGNIDIHCPDLASFKAASHPWSGPASMKVPMPQFPQSVCVECMLKARASTNAVAKL